jgi:2-oxoglutarate dehydrogenase E2 component (dihydrolipoamide succinyltransferase)
VPNVDIRMPEEQKEGTEASVGTWLKGVGDAVRENEPLVEISTDKVTIEIASPATGVLSEVLKPEGDAVFPGELLGRIQTDVGGVSEMEGSGESKSISSAKSGTAVTTSSVAVDSYSPSVRRLLREHNIDPARVPKVGRGGRLTVEDVEAYLAQSVEPKAAGPDSSPGSSKEESRFTGRRVAHTPMRRSIANHMARSVQAAPHVTSVFEADLSRVLSDRETRKAASNGEDVPSVTAYLLSAVVQAIKVVPEVNSKWHEDALEIFDEVNLGFGTALDKGGLVVPVIHFAHKMDLLSLARSLRDLTVKARGGKLTQSDMDGGTFTISNHGVSGSLLAAPIILPHGQAAILGAGKLQRRVVVCESGGRELFRIRPMMYVTLTVDHRVLDGQQTNGFLTAFVKALETSDWNSV